MPETYDGFISYSHAADDLLAPRLQAGLQRFAKPWWKRRALRLFRDESSLSANPHLWSSITDALDGSEWFVLLLSEEAAQSEWVNQEISYWVEHKDSARILPVVTDGEFGWADGDVSVSSTAAPPALSGVFEEEPRWVDLRWARTDEQLDLSNPQFSDAVADIASAIRGIPKDELESEEVRQHRRTIRTAWAAGVVVLVLAVVAGWASLISARNAEVAQGNALLASARVAAEEDIDLALLLALEANRHLGSGSSAVEEVMHNLLLRGTRVNELAVVEDAISSTYAVAVDSAGDSIAVSPSGNQVFLFDSDTLALRATLGESNPKNSSSIPGIAFSHRGDLIAAIGTDGIARVWDVSSGALSASIATGEDDTGFVLFGNDDQTLFTSIHARTAWDLSSHTELWRNDEQVQAFGGAPMALDRHGDLLAWANKAFDEVTAVDAGSGEVLWRLPLPIATFVDFHPTADVMLVKGQTIEVELHDYSSGDPDLLHRFSVPGPSAVVFDGAGERFAAGSDRGTVVYAATDPTDLAQPWTRRADVPTGAPIPLSLRFVGDGLLVGQPRAAGVWSLTPQGEVARVETDSFLWMVEAVPHSSLVLTGAPGLAPGNAVAIRDLADGTTKSHWDEDRSDVPFESGGFLRAVKLNLAVGYLPGMRRIATFDPSTGDVRRMFDPAREGGRPPTSVDMTGNGEVAMAVYADSSDAVLWNAGTGAILDTYDITAVAPAVSVSISATGGVAAIGGSQGVLLIDLDTHDTRHLVAEGLVVNVAFSLDGSTLAASDDTFGILNIYDVSSGERRETIAIPGSFDLEFSDNEQTLLLAGAQSGVIAFDTRTWTRRWTIPIETLQDVVLTLDVAGDRLVFADVSGVIHELTLDPDELIRIATDRVSRPLTAQECEDHRIDPCPSLEEIRNRA